MELGIILEMKNLLFFCCYLFGIKIREVLGGKLII